MVSFISTCAPSASFNVILYEEQAEYQDSLLYSGFMCTQCQPGPYYKCLNCSFCLTGTYSSGSSDSCLKCPAGNYVAFMDMLIIFRFGKKSQKHLLRAKSVTDTKLSCVHMINCKIKIKMKLLSFQEVFIRTKWVKLNVRIAAQVLMFPRCNILEKAPLTVVHALMVRKRLYYKLLT